MIFAACMTPSPIKQEASYCLLWFILLKANIRFLEAVKI